MVKITVDPEPMQTQSHAQAPREQCLGMVPCSHISLWQSQHNTGIAVCVFGATILYKLLPKLYVCMWTAKNEKERQPQKCNFFCIYGKRFESLNITACSVYIRN